MLKVLRQKGVAKKVLWVIATIIIISFGFGFGISRYSTGLALTDAAGKLFGKKISVKEFRKASQDTRDQIFMMYGPNAEKVLPMMDLDNEAWTRLTLIKEADTRQVTAQDGEVIAYIQNVPLFQRDGEFDRGLYENIVKYTLRREPRSFEEGVRDQIRIMKMFRAETDSIKLADEAVRKEYERRNQKVQVNYVLFDPKKIAEGLDANPADIQAYYDAHKEEFLEPEKVTLQYASFPLPDKATEEIKKAVADKAAALKAKLEKNGDLMTDAKAAGAEVRSAGPFTMEAPDLSLNWSLDLLQSVFTAKEGTILGPVANESTVQILKVTAKTAAVIPPFEKAKTAVKDKILGDKALEIAKKNAADGYKTLAGKTGARGSFEDALKATGLTAKQTPFFGLGDYVPEIGISEDFISAAFALNKDKPLSEVVITSRGPVVLHWDALQPADPAKFNEVKKEFTASLEEEQRSSTMTRAIKEIKDRAQMESYLKAAKK